MEGGLIKCGKEMGEGAEAGGSRAYKSGAGEEKPRETLTQHPLKHCHSAGSPWKSPSPLIRCRGRGDRDISR